MYPLIKRCGDLVTSFLLLVIMLPLFVLISVLVYLDLGRPIFFRQVRIGKSEKPFIILKFRTMVDGKHQDNDDISDDFRTTAVGSFLRKSSLDELPTLWNVLVGDMSIVGPRPLLPEYLPLYSIEQRKRHLVKPGITGLAQVNGRNLLSWEDKFKFDVFYVSNQSIRLDLQILLHTVVVVFKREGINSLSGRIVEKFRGSSR